MIAAIIAVLGTLLGAVTAGVLQQFATKSARRDRDRQALAAAVAGLLGAATDHRSHQYLKHVLRRQGGEETLELRAARYEARSAMTKALTALVIATDDPGLLALAERLVAASNEVGEQPHADRTAVDEAGNRAREAHAALQRAAANHMRRARG
ncbi:protein kilB [Streptomyces longisporus]|uniref:protein kilB n=1 Tax=Streptomyces longisporus TaxID=1948 RepID=UPI0031DC5037